MTAPKTDLYTIYYRDGNYLSYDLTKKDVDLITQAMSHKSVIAISIGTLHTEDIRSLIKFKPVEDIPQHKGAEPDLDKSAQEWVEKQRQAEEILAEEGDDDYGGGMMV